MAKPKVISLFSGCGGMDYGFEAAGFKTVVAVEIDTQCCETLKRNRRRWPVICADIFDVPSRAILECAGVGRREADLVIGGPPCQPFSKSGYWATGDSARLDDDRADTLTAYMRVVRDTLPKAFVLENVTGLAYSGKDEGFRHLLAKVRAINRSAGTNYQPYVAVLQAAKYGVPQLRERFFMVAARDGSPFDFPAAMFRDPDDTGEDALLEATLPAYRTAWDALGDLDEPLDATLAMRGRWAALLPTIPEGSNYLWHTDRGGGVPLFGWRRRYWNFLLKLSKTKPSWTIQAQPGPSVGPFHWNNRRLSVRELCRIQTFPDEVHIVGNRGAAQKQIGNAVPSLLTEVLGRKIRTDILRLPPLRRPLRLLPPKRCAPPAPMPVPPVPDQYLALIGTQTPHPGTGKGAGALARLRAVG